MPISLFIKLGGFLGLSILLGYLSRTSLHSPRSHGFYRFLAWESILGLFFTNVGLWFQNPFSIPHLISWLLLFTSGFLVLHAAWLLQRFGEASDARDDITLLGFEKTTRIVEEGAYRFIRHPLYASLLYLAWGIFFKEVSWASSFLVASATGFLILTASVDEAESIRYFGPAYQEYTKRTKKFIPFLY